MGRLAIVEDHGLVAHGLARALEARGHEARRVEVTTSQRLIDALLSSRPDLVLLDLDLGRDVDTENVITQVAAKGIRVLVVTGLTDPISHAGCVAAGAIGVVDKSSSFEELVAAIDQVAATGSLLSKHDREEHLAQLRAHRREERERLAPFARLTPREAQVLGELMRGRSVPQIARRSFVSKDTVRTQVRAIRTKLGVASQLEAIALARDTGWDPPPEG